MYQHSLFTVTAKLTLNEQWSLGVAATTKPLHYKILCAVYLKTNPSL